MDRSNPKPIFVIQTYADRGSTRPVIQDFPSEIRSPLPVKEALQNGSTTRQSTSGSTINPPPPPPLPIPEAPTQNGTQENGLNGHVPNKQPPKTKPKAPPVPIKYSTLSYDKDKVDYNQPPPCPTPDYDTLSITSNSTLPRNTKLSNGYVRNGVKASQNIEDNVEMESLESFKLNNPSTPNPKPPSIYFNRPKAKLSPQVSNSSISSTNNHTKQRPVSITIGEYPSTISRRQPGKLDFLNGAPDGVNGKNGVDPIGSQLASELAQTLGRSNLKKRTDSLTNGYN